MSLFNTSYFIIQPTTKGFFSSDWRNCLEQINSLLKNDLNQIFKLNFFINAPEFESFQAKKQFITEALLNFFGEKCPTFGILAQSPEKSYNLSIEVGIVDSSDVRISYRKYKEHLYTILENDKYKELWANGLEDPSRDLDIESHSRNAFDLVQQILFAEKMSFDNIVRQWNYIGSILQTDEQDESLIQHYQIFNEVRQAYYSRFRSVQGFPAATGIGMKFNGVSIDFCAVTPCEKLAIISVNNPNQINPYTYDQEVLIGTAIKKHEHKTPPQFERAKLLACLDKSKLFVSGTASIIGQETMGVDDVALQTRITIENIGLLIKKENLRRLYPQLTDFTSHIYRYLRVYVKFQEDISIVKSICDVHFGNVPVNYVQADICREELLVEIEAELSSY
jgi:hypothetical protein